jgi:hypothetical protein
MWNGVLDGSPEQRRCLDVVINGDDGLDAYLRDSGVLASRQQCTAGQRRKAPRGFLTGALSSAVPLERLVSVVATMLRGIPASREHEYN